ncbi:MAG: sulfite exporter TauE/SafE family protein [Porcipelethomonas sp.]
MKKLYFSILGIITGITNGLFGSGGGIIAVPMLKKSGMSVKESHATSLALTLPLSIISCFFYMRDISFSTSCLIYIICFGLAGALIGGILMKKLPNTYLKKAFGIILIISGIRLFLK